MTERKIINDPVFGFIHIPKGLLYDIVCHPVMQRLTRIKQLGLAAAVYPGAQHTRFQHSLGAFHLMSEAITSLRSKGNFIFDSEAEAVQAAILLHDIGHGPFSHVLENTIVNGVSHEEISLMLMERINKDLKGQLNLAIQIFKDEYPKKFLHQLVSGQLDMDRLDYLRRDCFYTGVSEGNIGSARIIKMLDVKDDHLVVESKGIYSIENFLTSRRLMYWQVYLHKTSVACEKMLISTLLRAKELASQGVELFASPALRFFLYHSIDKTEFQTNPECLNQFIQLDDNDIWTALKTWSNHPDIVLSTLSRGLIDRKLFKVLVSNSPITSLEKERILKKVAEELNISKQEAKYFLSVSTIENNMYRKEDDSIEIIYNDGTTKDIAEASDMLNISLLSRKVKKYYVCFHRINGYND
ncbi:MAG: HD domain-containing protein [Bacteroides sp]|nr:HD domain-containing protein [Bacteroides sp.]